MRSLPGRLAAALACGFALLFVAAPLARMAFEVVHDGDGFTLRLLGLLFEDEHDRERFLVTLALGAVATSFATLLGLGHAWLTYRTDLPGRRVLGPLGVAPLVLPPIFVAMAFSDLFETHGFLACSALLGLCYAPFVAVLVTRGLRSVSGEAYEAARLARGPVAAERWLVRAVLPELAAGALLAFAFVVSEYGVPEFLTVKGKTWHTYAEGVFGRWTRRAVGADAEALASPIVAAVPLVAMIGAALLVALRLRGHGDDSSDVRPLPLRRLGRARFAALLLPFGYLGAGVVLPLVVMVRWAAGSTQNVEPMSLERLLASFRLAASEGGSDLGYTVAVGAATAAVVALVALPLARLAARRLGWIDHLSLLPLAVPAVLLGIGMVRVFNRDLFFDLYDSGAMLVAAYAARFLPFGVLTLSAAVRRMPVEREEAARLAGRSWIARVRGVQAPALASAIVSVVCLVSALALRELDLAVVLPAGNGTVVRRLSNIVHFGGEEMGGALALLLLASAVLVPALVVLLSGRRPESLS